MRQFLDFEKPVAELESKIEELRRMTSPGEINIADEVARLSAKADSQLKAIYSQIDALAENAGGAACGTAEGGGGIAALITDFTPLAGDRAFADDAADSGRHGAVSRFAGHGDRHRTGHRHRNRGLSIILAARGRKAIARRAG